MPYVHTSCTRLVGMSNLLVLEPQTYNESKFMIARNNRSRREVAVGVGG